MTTSIHEDLLQLLENQMPLVKELHAKGSLAPLAASMGLEGEILGEAFVVKDPTQAPTVEDVLDSFSHKFAGALQGRSIRASAIFFHGHLDGNQVQPAHYPEEAQMVVAWLWHSNVLESVRALINYTVRRVHGTERAAVDYETPAFSPMAVPGLPPPVIFMPRTFPRDGESTVIRIENELFELLRDRLRALYEQNGSGPLRPSAATMNANGIVDGEPLMEELVSGRSMLGYVNYAFSEMRRLLERNIVSSAAIFCYAAVTETTNRYTDDPADANMLIAWLAHKTQIVEVRLPYTGAPAAGESAFGSPTGDILETLPFISGQRVRWTFAPPPDQPSGIMSCAVTDKAVAIHKSGLVERWNMSDGSSIDAFSVPYKELTACAVASRCSAYITGSSMGKVGIWRADRHEEIRRLNQDDPVTACALSGGGTMALVAYANGTLLFWDINRGAHWREQGGHVCALSADGERALTGSRDGNYLWDIPRGEEPAAASILRSEQAELTAAALSDDGRAALTASADGSTSVWDFDLGKGRHALRGPAPVRTCALSATGDFALVAYDGLTVLWDAVAGHPLQQIQTDGHHTALAFTPDGTCAALGSNDGTLTFMELFPS